MTPFEWPVATRIDLDTYPRRALYEHFLTFENPVVNRTVQLDISALKTFVKSKGLRFSLTLGLILTRATNHVPEMRHRIHNNQLVEYNKIIPSFTILGPDKKLYFSKGVFSDSFQNDYPSNLSIIDRAAMGLEPNLGSDNQGQVFITNNPWYSFSALSFPYSSRVGSMPAFAIGKMYSEDDRTKAPLAIQNHHGLTDGYHIAHVLDILRCHLEDPGLIERPFVSSFK